MITNAKIVCVDADPETYHAQTAERGTPGFVMTSSAMREFARCAARWKNGYVSPDSDAKEWGSLMDCLTLTPDRFDSNYAVRPATYPAPAHHAKVKKGEIHEGDELAWNSNASYCAEWIEEQEAKGLEIVSHNLANDALAARKVLLTDEVIAPFIAASNKQVWLSATWQDKDSGVEFPLKALVDLAPRADSEFSKCLGDMKCVRNAAYWPFFNQMENLWWDCQAEFYRQMYVAATGEDRNTWCFVISESFAPWQVGRRMLSAGIDDHDVLACAKIAYEFQLKRYANALKTGKWTDYETDSVQGWTPMEPTGRFIESRTKTFRIGDEPTVDDLREQDEANGFGDGFSVGEDVNV